MLGLGINKVTDLFYEKYSFVTNPNVNLSEDEKLHELVQEYAEVRALSEDRATPIVERLVQYKEKDVLFPLLQALKACVFMRCPKAFQSLMKEAKDQKWEFDIHELMDWMINANFQEGVKITLQTLKKDFYKDVEFHQQPLTMALLSGRMEIFKLLWRLNVGTGHKDKLLQFAKDIGQSEIAQFIQTADALPPFPSQQVLMQMLGNQTRFDPGQSQFMDAVIEDSYEKMREIDFSNVKPLDGCLYVQFLVKTRQVNAFRGFLDSNPPCHPPVKTFVLNAIGGWKEGAEILAEKNHVDVDDLNTLAYSFPSAFKLALNKIDLSGEKRASLMFEWICVHDKYEYIPAFKEAGFDLNAEVGKNMTLLLIAIGNEKEETVRALIEAGVDLNFKPDNWDPNPKFYGDGSPLNFAKGKCGENSVIYQLLLEAAIKLGQ